jgi:hypothetical protein
MAHIRSSLSRGGYEDWESGVFPSSPALSLRNGRTRVHVEGAEGDTREDGEEILEGLWAESRNFYEYLFSPRSIFWFLIFGVVEGVRCLL